MSKNVSAQITGWMTLNKSSELSSEMKQKLLSAPEGQEARFQKRLVDLDVLPEDLQAAVLEVLESRKAEREALPPKEKGAYNTGEVLIHGRIKEGGFKNGEAQKDANGKERKHSLTAQVAFKVNGIERVLTDAKVASAKTDKEVYEALAASLL